MAKEFERILVPTDGSAVAKKAAQKALALAHAMEIDVIAMHVVAIPGLPTLYRFPDELPYEQLHDLIQKQGRSYLDELEELGEQLGVKVFKRIVDGHPADEIIKAAREDDLIVIGSKGRTGLDRLLMGSVAENVVRHAPCSVLLVR
jgi:nucleotide-binding universal stress UspA family protein